MVEVGGQNLKRAVATGSVFSTALIALVIERSAPERHLELLVDVGSGDSPYRYVFDHDQYVGIDRLPRGADALLVMADAGSLPVASSVADGVLCTEVIEHVPDEHALAAELARIAIGGATLLLSAPFVHGLHEQPYDFRHLTSIGLVSTLESAGWTVDSISSIGGPVVVSVDGLMRWMDSLLRRFVRLFCRKGSLPYRAACSPSACIQHCCSSLAKMRGLNLGPIDPLSAAPRLTLGYVVLATRNTSD